MSAYNNFYGIGLGLRSIFACGGRIIIATISDVCHWFELNYWVTRVVFNEILFIDTLKKRYVSSGLHRN